MNKIFKVIYSKVRNCYVVTSEFAKANTKSSTGSEKSKAGRKALLTLAVASAIACGGLVNVGAEDGIISVVPDTTSSPTAKDIYTKDGADDKFGLKVNVEKNRINLEKVVGNDTGGLVKKANDNANEIATIKGIVGDAANGLVKDVKNLEKAVGNTSSGLIKDVKDNATAIAEVKTALGDSTSGLTKTVNDTALKVGTLETTVAGKADSADVTAVEGRVTTIENELGDGTTSGLKKDVKDLQTSLGTKASQDDVNKLKDTVGDDTKGLVKDVADNKTNIDAVTKRTGDLEKKTSKLSEDGTTLKDMTTVSTKDLEISGKLSNGTGAETTIKDITDSIAKTKDNETAIGNLNDKTAQISYDPAKGTTINGVEIGDVNVDLKEKELINVNTINGVDADDLGTKTEIIAEATTRKNADDALDKRIGKVDTDGAYIKASSDANTIAKNLEYLDQGIGAKTDGEYVKNTKTVNENLKALDDQVKANTGNITKNTEDIAKLDKSSVKYDNDVKDKITLGGAGGTTITNLKDAVLNDSSTDAVTGKQLNKTNEDLKNEAKTREDADKALSDRTTKLEENTGGIKRNTEDTQTTIEGIVKVDNQGNIKDVKNLGAETITSIGDASIGGKLSVTGETSLKNTKVDGTLETTGKATFDNDVDVKGNLTVDGISMKNTTGDVHGNNHNSSTTITADGISNTAKITDRYGKVTESKFTHDEKGSTTYAHEGDATDLKEATSNVTADGVENIAKDSKGNNNTFTQTSTETKNSLKDKDEKNTNEFTQTITETKNTLKDEAGNISSTRQDAKGNYGYAKDADGNKSYTRQEGDCIAESVIGKDGKETKSEMTSKDITNTAKDGTIKNDAKNIVNSATGNISNSSATMDTTVTGEATESYGKLTTTVEGDESHTVKGNQINTINGTQSTTVKGNVSEDYKQDLTTNIGGNELHEVTGTKTETVTGKVTENFKGGQETNVTGDQTTTISGTQTTTATDIKRNASSSMMDIVDNEYGTNTETKVVGKTTTEVTIKGTGEKGEYIRGANEAKDTLTKGTLKNSETKTVEATSTEITDGSGNTSSTIQDKANLAGSVTNGTETGVSGIHAKDGIVSIDSAVTDGKTTSTINQKKDSITSAVGEGGNSTVIRQDKDNVTIASSNGTVAIVGKDIINNATGNMTNTVGGNLTTTVTGKTTEDYRGGLDTTVTGNEKHTVKGNQTNEVDGDQTNTIKGNQTTTVTGDISNSAANITNEATGTLTDKVGENTRVLDKDGITDTVGNTSFKQRVDDILMEAKNGTITNDAKNLVNKAAETITNEAVDITNNATGTISSNASEIKNKAGKLISNKVGENTYQNIEDGKITESIKNGTKQNLTQSDADGTNHSVVNGNKSSVTKQTSEEITGAVTDGTSTNVTQNTATSSNNTIASNGKANSVISTVNGTEFVNSDAAAPVTGASGAGTADRTTIKGNTITTGKVTMDYAEVMKDLGVRGNANITGKTTTGSLEVTGTSTLKGDVTMESNATVKENLTVEGTTTTKTLKVTDNATVGGTLDVAKKATFGDSVDIAKDLNVTGDVTAKSYKVGNNTYIDANGINANNQKITNVAPGELSENSTDAVNGSQLFATNRRIDQFDSRINEVGANAAAMANLHPMEFDADSKLNVAVGVGNYRNKTATAMGLFYRPNEDVMFNVSSTIGSSDNMIGGGVSFRLGSGGNKLKNKAFADAAEQNKQLKSQVDTLQAQMDALLSVINPNMSKDFPDVPENHWAYEAVSRLAGNDIIQGYEDGKYHGERTMTRYEMAVIIYKALQKGTKAEAKLVEEFKPELKAIAAHEKA